jgi:hypothetical protein
MFIRSDCMGERECLFAKHGEYCSRHPLSNKMIGYKTWPYNKGLEIDRQGEAKWVPYNEEFILNPKFNPESLPKKMFEQGGSDKIEEVKEQEPKKVEDIIKRYLESQQELMEMITTLFIRLNKFKEI